MCLNISGIRPFHWNTVLLTLHTLYSDKGNSVPIGLYVYLFIYLFNVYVYKWIVVCVCVFKFSAHPNVKGIYYFIVITHNVTVLLFGSTTQQFCLMVGSAGHYCLMHLRQCQITSCRVFSWEPPFIDVSPL